MKVSRENLLTFGSSLFYRDLREICDGLKRGNLCILPSDTGYSLAAYPFNPKGVARLEKILDGKREDPIPFSFDTRKRAMKFVKFTQKDLRLIEKLFPGPLTLVCKAKDSKIQEIVCSIIHTENTIGVRIPDSPVERQICSELEAPITTCAIRMPDGKIVQKFTDAIEVVNTKLSDCLDNFVIYAVQVPEIKYSDHSTVATVQGKFPYVFSVYRPGVIEPKVLKNALDSKNLSYCDVDDWT